MKSIQIDHLAPDFSAVKLTETEQPQPGPGQVLVKMRLSPINPSDRNYIHGTYHDAMKRIIWNQAGEGLYFDPARQNPCPEPPYALGGEGVGVVEATGSGLLAKRLKGKRVAIAGGPPNGAWQEYTVVDARKALPIPDSAPDEQGAMFFVNPLSAYILVHEVLRVPRGAWLLQTAAGSSLGKSVVRMSKKYGYRTINVVRSDANSAELKKLGADVVIETNHQDIHAEVYKATGGKGVQYALDCVGGALTSEVLRCLGLDGHLVSFGTLADAPVELPPRDLMMPVARISGFYVPNWLAQQSPLKLLGILRKLKKLAAAGMFETEVSEIFEMENVHKALDAAFAQGRTGKILLRLGG